MDGQRREFVKAGGVLGLMVAAGLLTARQAQAQQAGVEQGRIRGQVAR